MLRVYNTHFTSVDGRLPFDSCEYNIFYCMGSRRRTQVNVPADPGNLLLWFIAATLDTKANTVEFRASKI
jgi:hypothetical protein